jgi:hypothetical protein
MITLPLISAGVVFVGTLVIGIVLHELSHALALRITGVPYTIEFLPGRSEEGAFRTSLRTPLARVTPTGVTDDLSSWQLRAAAMMPLCLLVPFLLVFLGVVPDPFAVGDLSLELATIAWLGCSVPSPGDFSLLWYPDRAIGIDNRG